MTKQKRAWKTADINLSNMVLKKITSTNDTYSFEDKSENVNPIQKLVPYSYSALNSTSK